MMNAIRQLLQLKGGDLWMISPDASVFEALRRMADKDVGALLVMEGERLMGIISERDYARKIILKGRASRDTLVSEIMTTEVYTIHPDQTVEESMAVMTNHRVRHLPVVENGQVIGMISIGDAVRDIIYRQRETIKSLEESRMRAV